MRDRLVEAMVSACAAQGFESVAITDVVAAAGVTREEFHEHFRDKQDCYLAGLDLVLADVIGVVSGNYSPDKPWFQVMRDATEALLGLLAGDEAHAKVALLEALPAGPAAFERYAAGKRVLVSLIDQGRSDALRDVILPSTAAQLVCGAVESVIADELIAGRGAGLPGLQPELLYMIYVPYMEQDQAISLSGITPDSFDPNNGEMPKRVETELPHPGRRTDLMEAMIKVCVNEGYENAKVDRIVAEAGVDLDTFYEEFADRQACLVATFDYIFEHVVYSVNSAFESEAEFDLPGRMRSAVAGLLDWFSAEPRMAHLAVVGMATAGPAAHRHYRKAVHRFLPLLAATRDFAPYGDRLPSSLSRLALGSITQLLFDEIHAGRTERLPEKLPELVYGALVPYLGTREASLQMKHSRPVPDR